MQELEDDYNSPFLSDSDIKNAIYYCTICCEERVDIYESNAEPFQCLNDFYHKCCNACFKAYLLELVNSNKFGKILCPHDKCTMEITTDLIDRLFKSDPEVSEKIKKFMIEREKDIILLRHCTKSGCPGSMMAKNKHERKLSCPICSTKVCF